jgi:hypothetical protein
MKPTEALVIALISGLAGAFVTAMLSFVVRLKAKEREDIDERRRRAHVVFLSLTDVVGAHLYVRFWIERVVKSLALELNGYDVSHACIAYISKWMADPDHKDRKQLALLVTPIFSALASGVDEVRFGDGELGRMSEVTIYSYHRYRNAGSQMRIAVSVFEKLVSADSWQMELASGVMHSAVRAYTKMSEAAGILKATLEDMAGVSPDYAKRCLVRSYKAAHNEVSGALEQNAKLDLARKASQEAAAADVLGLDVTPAYPNQRDGSASSTAAR